MRRKIQEEVIKDFKEEWGDRYDYINYVFKGTKIKGEVICNSVDKFDRVHGSFWISYECHKGLKNGCQKCANISPLSDSEIDFRLKDRTDINRVGHYINSKTKIEWNCGICNKNWFALFDNIQRKRKCPYCAKISLKERMNATSKTHEWFLDKTKEIYRDEYEILETYVNTGHKLKIKHKKCGRIFLKSPNQFIVQLAGCPRCKSSKGEKKIENWLIAGDFKYETQKRFKDCKYKKSLPFDFVVLNEDDSLKCLIEYDGIQHFEVMRTAGRRYFSSDFEAEGYLYDIEYRDNIKNKYCEKNNIRLLRISYKDFKRIEEILERELK